LNREQLTPVIRATARIAIVAPWSATLDHLLHVTASVLGSLARMAAATAKLMS
jgi:hypothetical protein